MADRYIGRAVFFLVPETSLRFTKRGLCLCASFLDSRERKREKQSEWWYSIASPKARQAFTEVRQADCSGSEDGKGGDCVVATEVAG
jgi:hypothetical protein